MPNPAFNNENDPKRVAFQYFLSKMLDHFDENSNDLSTLKALKLLFFMTAADIERVESEKSEEPDLLIDTTFNDFHALPLGHVESPIYNYIKSCSGQMQFLSIDKTGTSRGVHFDKDTLAQVVGSDVRLAIDKAILYLLDQNPDILKMNAYDLVELSHQWHSWLKTYEEAEKEGSYSGKIPADLIKSERKYFHLSKV